MERPEAPPPSGSGRCAPSLRPMPSRALYNPRRCRSSRVRQRSIAWRLVDRAAPDTVPNKAVPPECGSLGRVRPAPWAQGSPGCASTIAPVCSCAPGASSRSGCAGAATAVSATARPTVRAWRATPRSARRRVAINAAAADAWSTPKRAAPTSPTRVRRRLSRAAPGRRANAAAQRSRPGCAKASCAGRFACEQRVMTIAPRLSARILRLYDVERWRVGTIARQLRVRRDTVRRVLAATGRSVPSSASPSLRPSRIDV